MLTNLLTYVLYGALIVHMMLLGVAMYRVWRGENVIDRLMGADLISTLTLAVLVLMAVIQGRSIFIDVALGLAALGFIATIALSKYIADEQVF